MAETAIEWSDVVWNPITGCDRVSPGCAHCYALTLAKRLKGMGNPRYQNDGDPKTSGPGFGVTLHPDKLEEPTRWKRPRMVFVNSMSDLFHEAIPDEYIARVFAVMSLAERHTFQVLTKRPERMRDLLGTGHFWNDLVWEALRSLLGGEYLAHWPVPIPLPNVWLGVSIENRRFVHRADVLRETPAAVRFISAEPLLTPLVCDGFGVWSDDYEGAELDLTGIDWLICGGESGAHFRKRPYRFLVGPDVQPRPDRIEWVRDLRDACLRGQRAGTPRMSTAFFFKQWGGRTPKAGGRELDGRTWDEMPAARQEALL